MSYSRSPEDDGVSRRRLAGSVVLRALVFTLLWWAFAEGIAYEPLIALAAIATATVASVFLSPVTALSLDWRGTLAFVPYFLLQSIAGGVDVAWRALHPALPIRPGFIEVAVGLPDGPPRVLLAGVVCLLPGTLSAEVRGDILLVHVLDIESGAHRALAELQRRVARVFAVPFRDS